MGDAANLAPAGSSISFRPLRLGAVWNVRGDPRSERFAAEVDRRLGALPRTPLTSTRRDDASLLWLGPRSWLFVTAPGYAGQAFDDARHGINAAGGALFDVSASYVGWVVGGTRAARVLARECPLDLDGRAFPPGSCAQSLLGHVGALFHRPMQAEAFVVMVARSFAADGWHLLVTAAASEGAVNEAPVDFPGAAIIGA